MKYLALRNWADFQHYRDRCPPWIKLHNSILEDYDFSKLSDETKWHIVASFLLASRTGNKIPSDGKWISNRIGASSTVSVKSLLSSGMFEEIQDDTEHADSMEQDASNMLERGEESRAEESIVLAFHQTFWKTTVPNRNGSKSKALVLWVSVCQKEGLEEMLRFATEWRKRADAERDPKFSPNRNLHPSTWLSQRRWESYDEGPSISSRPTPQAKDMLDGLKMTFDDE